MVPEADLAADAKMPMLTGPLRGTRGQGQGRRRQRYQHNKFRTLSAIFHLWFDFLER